MLHDEMDRWISQRLFMKTNIWSVQGFNDQQTDTLADSRRIQTPTDPNTEQNSFTIDKQHKASNSTLDTLTFVCFVHPCTFFSMTKETYHPRPLVLYFFLYLSGMSEQYVFAFLFCLSLHILYPKFNNIINIIMLNVLQWLVDY